MDALREAQAKFNELKAENAKLEATLSDAVDRGDEDRVLSLRRRAYDLPVALALAEVKVIDLRIAALRASSVEAAAESRSYRPDIKQAEADVRDAQARLDGLRRLASDAEIASRVSMDIGSLVRRRDELMAGLAERPGHVVRMR